MDGVARYLGASQKQMAALLHLHSGLVMKDSGEGQIFPMGRARRAVHLVLCFGGFLVVVLWAFIFFFFEGRVTKVKIYSDS